MGAHLWANRTSELPLMILWAARVIHPERSGGLDLEREIGDFYARFYRVRLDRGEIASILQDRP
jgi:iron complex transport system substrate-binding protein